MGGKYRGDGVCKPIPPVENRVQTGWPLQTLGKLETVPLRVYGTSGNEDGYAGTFFHQHVRDTFIILEEVNLPHPQ